MNGGCTLTKTIVASARAAYMARRASDYGVETGPMDVNMTVVRRRKRDIMNQFRGGSEKSLNSTEGVDLIMGSACFIGPKELEVNLDGDGSLRLTAERVFINTGTRPTMPSVEGVSDVPALNSTTVMKLDTVSDHLLVLDFGGSYALKIERRSKGRELVEE